MQLPSGLLADSVGPRRLFTAGSLVAGAGSLLFALAPGVGALLLGRALVGFGVAVAFVSVLKLIASWFREREFGTYTGLLMFIGNFGGILAAWPLAWITQHVSWRIVFAGAGVASLLLAAATWRWVRDHPAQAGLAPGKGREASPERIAWRAALSRVARNRWTWVCFAAQFGVISAFLSFSGLWAIPYLSEGLGMERSLATVHATLMILGLAVGALAAGAASDRMGRRLPLMRAMLTVFLACWLPWVAGWALPASLSLAVFFLMGLGAGGLSITWACAKELNPIALAGTATSLVNTAGFAGTALLQPLVGWMLDLSGGDYRQAVLALGAVALAGVASAWFIPETYCRNR
jgi:sugar phosphate permease